MIITVKLKNGIRCLSLSVLSWFGWAGILNPAQAASCTFTKITSGTIVKSSTGLKALEASAGLGGSDGVIGTVRLNCNNGESVSIGPPNKISAPPSFTPTISHALLQLDKPLTYMFASNGEGPFAHAPWTGQSTTRITMPNGISILSIGMIVGDNNLDFLPGGSYIYSTVLTILPN